MLNFPVPMHGLHPQNPATTFVTTGEVLMGLTVPTYNGTPCTNLQANGVTSPTCEFRHKINLPIHGVNYGSAAVVTAMHPHTISSPVLLPQPPVNGYWSEPNVSGRRIIELLTMICTKRERDGQKINETLDPRRNQRLIDPFEIYTFRFKPEPDVQTFMNHIEFHEYQHIADHRWLAKQIIGRWDDLLSDLFQGGNLQTRKMVVSRDPQGTLGLANGFNYSIGVARIMMYWARVASYSGDLYHDTAEGDHPVLRIEQVAGDEVIVVLRPKKIIHQRPNIQNPTPHREMAVKSRQLDGTETDLKYGPPGPFPQFSWRKLTPRHFEVS